MKKYIILIIAILPILYLLILLPDMPSQVVVHWNAQGEADRYGSRFLYVFLSLIPVILLGFNYIYQKYNKIKANSIYQNKTINALVIMFAILAIMLTKSSSSEQLTIIRPMVGLFGGLFIYIGNLFNKLEPNKTFGIRIPATLKSDKVWRRTHYIGGYVFVITGFITLLTAIFISNPTTSLFMMIGLLLVDCIIIFSYAQKLYKQEQKESEL